MFFVCAVIVCFDLVCIAYCLLSTMFVFVPCFCAEWWRAVSNTEVHIQSVELSKTAEG